MLVWITVTVAAPPLFVRVVIDGFVVGNVELAMPIVRGGIGHQPRFLRHVLADDAFGGFAASCSIWKERALPPRSTRVMTTIL